MAEYSKIARGNFVSTGNAKVIPLPFQPTLVKVTNYSSYAAFNPGSMPWTYWDVSLGSGMGVSSYINVSGVLQTAVVLSNGITPFSAGLALQYGPQLQIASITKAVNPTVTTASPHGLSSGQVVVLQGLYQSPTTGMPQISGIPFIVTVTGPTTFVIFWDTSGSNYTALSGSPVGAYVRQVLYPWLYEPGVAYIGGITLGSSTLVSCTSNHNFVVGQQIAFRIPSAYGTTGLNSLPNAQIPGSPIYGYVTAVPANSSFVCNINSSSFSAFNENQPVSSVPGLQFAQVLAVGDVNTGGTPYSGGALYPSPQFPTFSGGVPTINGPAIQGAFVNNTQQGFVIGAGNAVIQGTADPNSHVCGVASDLIFWEAMFTDFGS